MGDVLASDELIDEPSDYGSMQPGTRLGRYELLVPVARGGMARVWAARLHGQRAFQKLVAIKTILPHLADEPEFERMFLDEARIASGVHHPNVCEIYELGEERRTLYLAMEWVSGDSLSRVLRASGKTEAVDPRVIARVVADACAGLHAAHELTDEDGRPLGVVHRDLSPHNILLTADGTAKVADFGVAKALGQLHEATSAGQLKGKIAYMAPEQVTGNGIDRRSDVFSLGCVLYEATTGQRPFRGEGDHQVMHAVLKGEFALPSTLVRGYPQELERIVQRALAPQPILRYPTAERMRFALEEFLARGHLVTQSNVAQIVKARIGEPIERRKERIRQASAAGEREAGWSEPPGNMTPSNHAHGGHRSGVKASGHHAARPHVQPLSVPPPAAPMPGFVGPASSMTIPHANPYGIAEGERGHTPASHPSHPGGSHPSHPGGSHGSHPGGTSFGAVQAPPKAFAQTALMPPTVPFTVPTASSLPPHGGYAGTPMPPPVFAGDARIAPSLAPPGAHGQPPLTYEQAQGAAPAHSAFDPSAAPYSVAPAGPPSDRQAGTAQYVLAVGIGVLLAAVIGVGGFYAWRARSAAGASAASTATSAPAAAGASTDVAAAGSAAVAPASGEIAFTFVPAEATLSVDGKELGAGVRTVKRPEMGTTVTVVARAKGHEDVTVLVDFFTTSPMDLTLKPVAVANEEPATGAGAAADEGKAPPKKDPPKPEAKGEPKPEAKGEGRGEIKPEGKAVRQAPKGDPSLPANPY